MRVGLARVAVAFALGVVSAWNVQAYDRPAIKIASRPVTPRDIKDQRPLPSQKLIVTNLPSTTQKAPGLFATGVGQPVYLEVELTNKSFFAPISYSASTNSKTTTMGVTSVVWSVSSSVSTVGLTNSPLTNSTIWPIYDRGDRNLYYVPTNKVGNYLAARVRLIPDQPGEYVVTVQVSGYSVSWTTNQVGTTNELTLTTTSTITAGNYVGAETCSYCHGAQGVADGVNINDNYAGWNETAHSCLLYTSPSPRD